MRRGADDWMEPTAAKSAAMRRVRTSGTAPETALRSRLHGAGARFRVGYPVPGRPRRSIDIAFTRRRLAVFVDGCFWHGCPIHGGIPKANRAFWAAKREENLTRDRDTDRCLREAGWAVVRIWEHVDAEVAASEVLALLASRDGEGPR